MKLAVVNFPPLDFDAVVATVAMADSVGGNLRLAAVAESVGGAGDVCIEFLLGFFSLPCKAQ